MAIWQPVLRRVVGQPYALQDLQAVALGDRGDLIEAVLDRIGADAIGVARQQSQIFVDLARLDMGALHQRILAVAKRRVGDAVKLAAGGERGRRQLHRRAEPPPHDTDRQRGERKMRKRRTPVELPSGRRDTRPH